MTIFGMTRVKNETRWIRQVLGSYLDLCERIWLFDDHSTDGTPEVAEQLSEKMTVIRSHFPETLNESRDKTYMLSRVMGSVSDIHLRGDEHSPFWVICFDGDEVLDESGVRVIRNRLRNAGGHAFKLAIRYLWDSDLSLLNYQEYGPHRRVRVDGVYKTFARPSIFRLFNGAFRFQNTPHGNGANFHCSSIPQELLGCAQEILAAQILHLGYNDKADRIRKFQWYNKIDPHNEAEGRYLHCVQGDGPVTLESGETVDVPIDAKLKHAGPLAVEMM